MKKFTLDTGRVNQKAQTRTKILEAAKVLTKKKKTISLEDIAKKANISRATVYRYYSSVDLLIAEAALDIHHKSPDEINEDIKNMSFEERLFYIQEYYNQLAQKHELVFRRYLSAVLAESATSKKKLRGARRVSTLKSALKPFEKDMAKENHKKLISAATFLMGIDPVVVGKDVCGLSNNEIKDTLKWSLSMIIKGIKSGT